MAISFKIFERWAKKKFGDDNVKVSGNEIKINSIFESGDTGHHLWCNPFGGKNKRQYGTYHCWKTGNKGSLVKLVMIADSCPRDMAVAKLHGQTSIRDLEKQLESFFEETNEVQNVENTPKPTFELPPHSLLISELGTNNYWRKRSESYLVSRKIPIDGLYVCIDGKYKNRLVIPYYDQVGNLIYWNARTLGNSKCKYIGPPKEVGVGKEDVIFMAGGWAPAGSMLYVCEGELNALSMRQAEFYAAACGGKNMSDKQAAMLSKYKIVICLDRDKAGKAGTIKMSSMVAKLSSTMGVKEKLFFVIPPVGCNDWNQFLVEHNAALLHHYIIKNQKALDFQSPFGTAGDFFGYSDIWR